MAAVGNGVVEVIAEALKSQAEGAAALVDAVILAARRFEEGVGERNLAVAQVGPGRVTDRYAIPSLCCKGLGVRGAVESGLRLGVGLGSDTEARANGMEPGEWLKWEGEYRAFNSWATGYLKIAHMSYQDPYPYLL